MCVCVEERWYLHRWSSWSVMGSIALKKNFDLSMGYRQVKSEPTMFVMLSYSCLIPRAYTITSFGLTNTITVFTWWWKSSDMEILMSCCWAHQQHFVSSMIHVEHWASVGNFISIIFMSRAWSICSDERSDYLWFTCIWWKLPPWIRESLFCFLWNHPKSVMHTCEVLCGLETWNLHSICVPSTPSHWLFCSRIISSTC